MTRNDQLIADICRVLGCKTANMHQKRHIRNLISAYYAKEEQEMRKEEGKRLFKRTIKDLNLLPSDVRAEVLQNLCAVNFYRNV